MNKLQSIPSDLGLVGRIRPGDEVAVAGAVGSSRPYRGHIGTVLSVSNGKAHVQFATNVIVIYSLSALRRLADTNGNRARRYDAYINVMIST